MCDEIVTEPVSVCAMCGCVIDSEGGCACVCCDYTSECQCLSCRAADRDAKRLRNSPTVDDNDDMPVSVIEHAFDTGEAGLVSVGKLRDTADYIDRHGYKNEAALFRDAADEIERLESDLRIEVSMRPHDLKTIKEQVELLQRVELAERERDEADEYLLVSVETSKTLNTANTTLKARVEELEGEVSFLDDALKQEGV